MLTFQVEDMSCGHCVRAIKEAVRSVHSDAEVDVDLTRHVVRVRADSLDAGRVRDAVTLAGYTPVAIVAAEASLAVPASGACCGGARCMCGT